MWRILRISVLLIVLASVVRQAYVDRADLDWKDNFYIALYPVNADGSKEVDGYIKGLKKDDFEAIEVFFTEEAAHYQLGMRRPIAIQLGDVVNNIPPPPPREGNVIQNMLWSLRLRWFAWKNSPKVPVNPDIRLYLLFYDPGTYHKLQHSTALDKGRLGRVNLFGSQSYAKKNLVVTAHELLHTLSATDKYDLSTGQPIYPDGFAHPEKLPLFPQNFAELMGGYVPINSSEKKIPLSLDQTLIGPKTAREIGWIK